MNTNGHSPQGLTTGRRPKVIEGQSRHPLCLSGFLFCVLLSPKKTASCEDSKGQKFSIHSKTTICNPDEADCAFAPTSEFQAVPSVSICVHPWFFLLRALRDLRGSIIISLRVHSGTRRSSDGSPGTAPYDVCIAVCPVPNATTRHARPVAVHLMS